MAELMTPAKLLEMLEGNRRLTVRTIEAFPEEKLFGYSPAEPLRPFADMVKEILMIERDYVNGIATGQWVMGDQFGAVTTKADLLAACAAVRQRTLELWPQVTIERLAAVEKDGFFGDWEQGNLDRLIYGLENEVHHRAQGFTYLRLLGIEPPAFYER